MMDLEKHVSKLSSILLLIAFVMPTAYADLTGWLIPDLFNINLWDSGLANCVENAPDNSWVVLSFVAVLFSAIIAALAYMFSGYFGSRMLAWSKEFGKNTIISLILVASLFAAQSAMYSNGVSQIEEAQVNALIIRNTIFAEFVSMTVATAVLSIVGNLTPYLRPAGIIGISFSLQPAFKPIFDGLGITLSMLTVSMGEWFAQIFLLCFAKTRMLALFMPIGIFLRSFSLTDRAGNVLIALALGFFFVYPFMVNLTAHTIDTYLATEFGEQRYASTNAQGVMEIGTKKSCLSKSSGTFTMNAKSMSCHFLPLVGKAAEEMVNTVKDGISKISSSPEKTGGAISAYAILLFLVGGHAAATIIIALVLFVYSVFKVSIFYIIIVSVLMPLLTLFVTLTAIKEIAGLLGTQVNLGALEKLI